jgi:hypothetical protein
MQNEYLDNKVILKYCPNYYRIINEEFYDLDFVSDKVIQVLQSYIFSVDIKNKPELKRITELDKALVRYFDDREFKTYLTNHLIALKVSKKEPNIMRFIAMSIIGAYEKYLEGFTRNLYISKWI